MNLWLYLGISRAWVDNGARRTRRITRINPLTEDGGRKEYIDQCHIEVFPISTHFTFPIALSGTSTDPN
jgi:hypothetical protein